MNSIRYCIFILQEMIILMRRIMNSIKYCIFILQEINILMRGIMNSIKYCIFISQETQQSREPLNVYQLVSSTTYNK